MIFKLTDNNNVFFVRFHKEGAYFWHYISVAKNKLPLFNKISKNQNIELKEFGEILDSGLGILPPAEVASKYPNIKL